jgi:hypothetical protein
VVYLYIFVGIFDRGDSCLCGNDAAHFVQARWRHNQNQAGQLALFLDNADNGGMEGDGDCDEKKRPASLKDNIHTILNGTPEGKRKLQGAFFHLCDTPDFMKKEPINLYGDYFTVRYSVIDRHKNKDTDHNLTEQNWLDLQEEMKKPIAMTKYDGGYNLYTNIKVSGKNIMVGVKVRNAGHNIKINGIKTAFGTNKIKGEIVYESKNITPAQAGLLGETNLLPLRPARSATDTLSENPADKSRAVNKGFTRGLFPSLSSSR